MNDAERARNEAMRRVEDAADDVWKTTCSVAIAVVAARNTERFTTDEVWNLLDAWGVKPPREPRIMGPMITRAIKRGLIEPTGERVNSTLVRGHARPVRVFRKAA
jgi:hypothetical protein